MLGEDPDAVPLPEIESRIDPLRVLEEVMIPYLERPPCLVSFSGGRDSSVVLAAATAVARREGLELPIPITQRFPTVPEADESAWQELVVRHVRPSDWVRQVVNDELDLIGSVAREHLVRYGVLWPPNSFAWLPMIRAARGGAFLSGFDGDGLFRLWPWARAASVLAGRIRPKPRDALRVGLAVAPARLRQLGLKRKYPLDLSWMSPQGQDILRRQFYGYNATEPLRWSRRVQWFSRQREVSVFLQTIGLIARNAGATVAHPLIAPRFLAALARAGGVFGFGELPVLLRTLFGSLLPPEVLARNTKAGFTGAFFGRRSREFMAKLNAAGAQLAFVDGKRLLSSWREGGPDGSTAGILQALWLERQGFSKDRLPVTTVDASTERS